MDQYLASEFSMVVVQWFDYNSSQHVTEVMTAYESQYEDTRVFRTDKAIDGLLQARAHYLAVVARMFPPPPHEGFKVEGSEDFQPPLPGM
jgi:hypothetical protein